MRGGAPARLRGYPGKLVVLQGKMYATILLFCGIVLLLPGCKKAQTTESPSPPLVEVVKVIAEGRARLFGMDRLYRRVRQCHDPCPGPGLPYLPGLSARATSSGKDRSFSRSIRGPFKRHWSRQRGSSRNSEPGGRPAKANLERIKPLVEQNAVSKKDLDDAVGAEQATMAAVLAAQAVVDKAQVDLDFTRIISPIDGIAGIARAQLGDLVGPGSIEELTTVSTVNPIKVYVPMSEQEYLKYAQSGPGATRRMPLELLLADGSTHPHKGTFAFADRQVDVRTGTIKVAALFPNPGNVLRPGQFARVRAQTDVRKGALLVPQRAVMRAPGRLSGGRRQASDNKVDIRPVKVAGQVGSLWVIDEGLKPGEQVIAEGLQKVKDGDRVTRSPSPLPRPAASRSPRGGRRHPGPAVLRKPRSER